MARHTLGRYSKPVILRQLPQVTTNKLFTPFAIVASQSGVSAPAHDGHAKLPILTPCELFFRFQGFANPPLFLLLRPT